MAPTLSVLSFFSEIDAPKNPRLVQKTSTTLELEWDNSEADVEGYQVVYSTLAGDQYEKAMVPRTDGLSTKILLKGEEEWRSREREREGGKNREIMRMRETERARNIRKQ